MSQNTQQPHLVRPHRNKGDGTSQANMATHSSHSDSGFAASGSQPHPRDTGGPSMREKSLPQYLSDSEEEVDEEEQLGFGHPDEVQEIDGNLNISLSNQSKFGGDGDVEDDGEEDEEDDAEGKGRMDGARLGSGTSKEGHEYQLRQNINREAFKGSGFVDQDKTGNYDPRKESDEDLELESVGRGRKRACGEKRKRDKGKGKAQVVVMPKKNSGRRARAEVDEDKYQDMPEGSQSGDLGIDASPPPQPQEGEGEEEDSSSSDIDVEAEDLAANSDVDPEEARMRKAAIKRRPRQPAVEPKPQSCHFCKSHALECSIQDDPAFYPCLACQDTGVGCILFTPHTSAQKSGTKRAQAKERKKAKELEKGRLARDREIEREADKRREELKRAFKKAARNRACTHCKDDGTTCSLEKLKEDEITGASCKRCVKHGHICTVELPPAADEVKAEPELRKARAPSQRPQAAMFGSQAFDRDETDEDDDADVNPPSIFNVADDGEPLPKRKRIREPPRKCTKKSRLSNELVPGIPSQELYILPPSYAKKQVTTSFCHPLVFNALMPNGDEFNMACDFHLVAFSIFGLPSASPWVAYPDPPTSQHPWKYEEIPGTGGHSESTKHEKTNVCKECTYARQKILFCQGHRLAGIKGLPKPKDFDFDAAYASLLSDQERHFSSNTAAQHKWCAICPAPAFIECYAPFSAGPGQKEQEGCGLMLCEICAVSLLTLPPPDLIFPENLYIAQPQGEFVTEEEATKEVASLLRDVKRVNIQARSLQFTGQLSQLRQRKSIDVRRSLEEVIEEAKMAAEAGGGKGGKYQDGVRADVEFLSRKGLLYEWMEHEADRRRKKAYEKTSIVGSVENAAKKLVKKATFAVEGGAAGDVAGAEGVVAGGEMPMPSRGAIAGGSSASRSFPMPSRRGAQSA